MNTSLINKIADEILNDNNWSGPSGECNCPECGGKVKIDGNECTKIHCPHCHAEQMTQYPYYGKGLYKVFRHTGYL